MRRKLSVLTLVSSLAFAAVAVAATTAPVAGGHYKGKDSSKGYRVDNSVTISVTKSRANFASARFNFVLDGPARLGSCAGQAYVTVSPTKARQISQTGTFALHGSFPFAVATGRYQRTKYTAHVAIAGAFGDAGHKVSGVLQETASNKHLTCRSGKVRFQASLVK